MVKKAAVTGRELDLARRIRRERQRRALSYAELAQAMTDAGCTIDRSAIYRIEKGNPPRRVSVNELIAMGEVFGKGLDDLTTPIDLVDKQRAQTVISDLRSRQRQLTSYVADALRTWVEWFDLARDDEELNEYAANHLWVGDGGDASRYAILPFAVDPRFEKHGIDIEPIVAAAQQLETVIVGSSAELTRAVASTEEDTHGQ